MKARFFSLLYACFFIIGMSSIPSTPKNSAGRGHKTPTIAVASTAKNSVWDVTHVDISSVQPTRKLIALTFDDAPAKTLDGILSAFTQFNATHPDCPAYATLFCNGKHIYGGNKKALKRAHAAHFELGNHTQNHQKLTQLPMDALREEIDKTDALLEKIDGIPLHLLRAPYGDINNDVKRAAKTPLIDWLIDTKDWTGASADEIYQTVFSQKADGAIVLMHDGYEHTVTALQRLLPDLYKAGYQAVSVSQMAKAHSCPLKIGNVYIRARKMA